MRTRILALLSGLAICAGTALVAVPLTHADAAGAASRYKVLTNCDVDADGKMCVESATRDTENMRSGEVPDTVGSHEWFYVDNGSRDGDFGFNLNTKTIPASGPAIDSKSVDVHAKWVITVNTGSYVPRELNLKAQNVVYSTGGNVTDGYTFTIQFNPVPIAWRYFAPGFTCDMTYCGTDSTTADFVSGDDQGFADGYVSDLGDTTLGTRYAYARTGFYMASNAQYQAEPYYDAETNSLVVAMANPHLRSVGLPASGFFEAFIPNSYLTNFLDVPDPSSLTGTSVTIQRIGSTYTPTSKITNTGDGLLIKVSGVGFSRPRYKITPTPSVPGKPRTTAVVKVSGGAKIYFKAPLANGGRSVDRYSARCRRSSTSSWVSVAGSRSPLTIRPLYGTASCQVRAHNSIGWGSFGSLWTSH
ncbi:MAG: hypothetical protein ACJ716_16280 [Marmoricola sp.]